MKCLILLFSLLFSMPTFAWSGSFLLETASINPAVSPFGGLVAGSAPFNQTQFVGARFSLTVTTQLHHIGGHIVGSHRTNLAGQTVAQQGAGFLAIFPLINAQSFPTVDANRFETQAIFSTLLSPSGPRTDHLVPLSLFLSQGDYAVVFGGGSGRERNWFGSDGDIFFGEDYLKPSDSIIYGHTFRSSPTISWNESSSQTFGPRILIAGTPVPEPSTFLLFASGIIGVFAWKHRGLSQV